MEKNEQKKKPENLAKEIGVASLEEKIWTVPPTSNKKPVRETKQPTQAVYISIKDRPEDDRPREKMLKKGQSALSDAELLAILINTGTSKRSAIDLAHDVLSLVDQDLNLLFRKTFDDFQEIKGIGPAKAITLSAALELGRRRQQTEYRKKVQISSSKDAANFLIPMLQDKQHELFYVLYLNQSNKIIHLEQISSGGVTATVVDIKMILKKAIQVLASSMIVCHNHPSGNLNPSQSDRELTKKIKSAGEAIDVKLVDHLIIGENRYLSFADEGIL